MDQGVMEEEVLLEDEEVKSIVDFLQLINMQDNVYLTAAA